MKYTNYNMFYFLGGIILWYTIIFVFKTKTGSPSVMSKKIHIKKLVKYVKPGMRVADMGCGDAAALIEMIRAGAIKADGWEIEPAMWVMAQINIGRAGMQDQVKVRFGDMWRADLSNYDLVYVYQLTRYAPKFVKKCKAEMKPGSVVIANTYPLKGMKIWKRDGKIIVYKIA